MNLSTFQALVVALMALLPGASYTFAVERALGSFGVNFADRLVRFLASSAIFHAVASGPEYLLYRHYFLTNALARGEVPWWSVELMAVAYVFLPIGIGAGLAQLRRTPAEPPPNANRRTRFRCGVHRRLNKVALWALGKHIEPRAWDWMWNYDVAAILRIKLKSGTWIAGLWGHWNTASNRRSYAGGYPEDGDLYLSTGFQIDPATGELLRDSGDRPQPVDGQRGLLVRWNEIEYLDFQEF
ncbi:DUF6338 family protein [Amycolatopsis australiensis]|uniref:Uncharacterized protein n=1 Tax=Amycolatopsis australiensis TaxID=546364 RepID=A0A1K1LM62_9PSEU|nr:DUF6338 family protein [Amycolatopsis australiensis]SFW11972.1 hypothetical protein SAMN04489730_0076 [Amycolatopsis australiensis]